ncbi:hypothetical protein L484_025392 [Morus notabilis]|uniref:Uncharacterized protein n=1 Tax=Morus notabilis TaxID=981085 RepID=W9RQS1_9ROSA|nr:hypothetical protein L484_025392 [Morus notabilis]
MRHIQWGGRSSKQCWDEEVFDDDYGDDYCDNNEGVFTVQNGGDAATVAKKPKVTVAEAVSKIDADDLQLFSLILP